MVDVAVFWFGSTARSSTVSVSGDDGPALCRAPDTCFAADVYDFAFGPEDDPGYRTVAGDHAKSVNIDDGSTLGFVEPTGDPLEGIHVGVEVDVWLLSANRGRGSVVEPVPAQVF